MEHVAGDIESAIESGLCEPFMVTARRTSAATEVPRGGERFPVLAGLGGLRSGRRNGAPLASRDHAVLSVTVSADQVLALRKALVALAHPAIDMLIVTPLPGSSRVRLTACLASDDVDRLTQRILKLVNDRNPETGRARNSWHAEDAARGKTSATVEQRR